jgi:hypothetical protein
VDEDAVALKSWVEKANPSIPPPWSPQPGLVLVAEWGWADTDSPQGTHYQKLRDVTDEASGGLLYSYPAHATHVTISTLSSFKKPDAPRAGLLPSDDAELVAAWGDALSRALAEFKVEPFELEAYKIELSTGAAFLHFKDSADSSIGRLRALVADIRDSDPTLAALDDKLGGRVKRAVHLPDIVHSSYARFVGTPSRPLAGSAGGGASADGAELKAHFDSVASQFRPFHVRVTGLTLANECSPYMHQSKQEGTARHFPL